MALRLQTKVGMVNCKLDLKFRYTLKNYRFKQETPQRMRKHGIAIFSFVFTLLFIAYLYWPSKSNIDNTPASVSRNISSTESTEAHSSPKNQNLDQQISIDTSNYTECTQMLRTTDEHKKTWSRNEYLTWTKYIKEDGYSLNEVTLAVEYFLNSNFAEMFRVGYLRAEAPLTKKNSTLQSQVIEMFPSLIKSGIKVTTTVPHPSLVGFSDVPQSEKAQIIAENDITVDDIAYFLLEPLFPDNDILLLIEALKNSHVVVSYDRYAAISLLDYAIISLRPKIVEALLNRGHSPTQDEYLGSSMEWALNAMQSGYNNGKREQAANIILQLMDYSATARFKSQTKDLIEGYFPRRFYNFNAEKSQSLIIDFNLDLTIIRPREEISIDARHPLIEEIRVKQLEAFAKQRNIPTAKQLIPLCEDTVEQLNNKWTPRSTSTVIKEFVARYGSNEAKLMAELAKLDPILVDYYQRQNVKNRYRKPISKELIGRVNEAYNMFQTGEVQQGIEYVLTTPIHESQHEWVMLRLMNYGESYYPAIFNSPIRVDFDDYSILRPSQLIKSSISSMVEAGALLDNSDLHGKTLVFYAAQKRDVDLLSYLYENQFLYSPNSSGQDPMHVAINVRKNGADLQIIEATIDMLMKFQPHIDTFHLSRMALMKSYYPVAYSRIVQKHQSLKVEETTELPPVYLY